LSRTSERKQKHRTRRPRPGRFARNRRGVRSEPNVTHKIPAIEPSESGRPGRESHAAASGQLRDFLEESIGDDKRGSLSSQKVLVDSNTHPIPLSPGGTNVIPFAPSGRGALYGEFVTGWCPGLIASHILDRLPMATTPAGSVAALGLPCSGGVRCARPPANSFNPFGICKTSAGKRHSGHSLSRWHYSYKPRVAQRTRG